MTQAAVSPAACVQESSMVFDGDEPLRIQARALRCPQRCGRLHIGTQKIFHFGTLVVKHSFDRSAKQAHHNWLAARYGQGKDHLRTHHFKTA
jgi:hypothetical protein